MDSLKKFEQAAELLMGALGNCKLYMMNFVKFLKKHYLTGQQGVYLWNMYNFKSQINKSCLL